jgi:putative peptidoglycan lipid II flippase
VELNKVVRKTTKVSGITVISRIAGYVRDVVIAQYLGTSWLNDVFIAAFKLPNLFRALFAEGAFSAAFIPIFLETQVKYGRESAMKFAANVQAVLILFLMLFVTLFVVFMPLVIMLTTPGFANIPEAFNLVVKLGRIGFPYILFISLVALYGGVMNSAEIFSPFAFVSVIVNITMIIAAFCGYYVETVVHALIYGMVAGGILEFVWMLYFAKRNKLLLPLAKPQITSKIKKLMLRMLPSLVSFGVMQISVLISMIIASFIPGGMSYLYYADRIIQLPVALIGTAIGVVVLPSLSKAFSLKKFNESRKMVNYSFSFIIFFTIPAVVGIFYMAEDIVRLLFMRGQFTENSVVNTSSALLAFSFGIPAFSMNKLLTSMFYAQSDTKTPMKISIFTICINIMMASMFASIWRHVGIAMASSVAGWINLCCLSLILWNRNKRIFSPMVLMKEISKIVVASIMLLVFLHYTFIMCESLGILVNAITILLIIFASVIFYFCVTYILRSEICYSLLCPKRYDFFDK